MSELLANAYQVEEEKAKLRLVLPDDAAYEEAVQAAAHIAETTGRTHVEVLDEINTLLWSEKLEKMNTDNSNPVKVAMVGAMLATAAVGDAQAHRAAPQSRPLVGPEHARGTRRKRKRERQRRKAGRK